VTDFSEAELKTLATATLMAQQGAGFTIDAKRVADRMVADRLVRSGHLEAIDGIDGGYRLSDQMVAAFAIGTVRKAEEAAQN
jgi:hypothetical protein